MHLVETRFKQRYDEDLAAGDTSQKDILWWFGYLMGLLEGGLITQKEHDSLSSYIIEALTDEKFRCKVPREVKKDEMWKARV